MNLSDFDYDLPEDLIAQEPAESRDSSRLLVYERKQDSVTDCMFPQLVDYLLPGDLLVLNNTKVFPARLLGKKQSGGRVELLLVRGISEDQSMWLAMTRSSKPLKPGTILSFGDDLQVEIESQPEDMLTKVRLRWNGDLAGVLDKIGRIPLPPYIQRMDTQDDRDRYQTVFAKESGSIAAPTAGLHFTPGVLSQVAAKGVECATLTLHVGPGTFLPVRHDDLSKHRMHRESFEISSELADKVVRAKKEGRRIVAVGTTTTRALESAASKTGEVCPGPAETELFIRPGYQFKVVDALVTNFHLPRSTLLMLVSAFSGREKILDVYRHAVSNNYRFFSYGDCMFIV